MRESGSSQQSVHAVIRTNVVGFLNLVNVTVKMAFCRQIQSFRVRFASLASSFSIRNRYSVYATTWQYLHRIELKTLDWLGRFEWFLSLASFTELNSNKYANVVVVRSIMHRTWLVSIYGKWDGMLFPHFERLIKTDRYDGDCISTRSLANNRLVFDLRIPNCWAHACSQSIFSFLWIWNRI